MVKKKIPTAHIHHSSGTLSAKSTFFSALKVQKMTLVKPPGLLTKHEYSVPRTEASAHQIKCNLKKSLSFLSYLHLFPLDFPSKLWRMTGHFYSVSVNFKWILLLGLQSGRSGWSPVTTMQPPMSQYSVDKVITDKPQDTIQVLWE